ncbi:MAG: FecR family protein [Nitrospirota bacterium]
MRNSRVWALGLGAFVFTWVAVAEAQPISNIGSVTAVQRQANVMRAGRVEVEVVKLGGPVLFKDFYETKTESKLKLLFQDDSVLSLGQNTRLRITENIYDPGKNRRSTVLNLIHGTTRALVGKVFTGAGSKFEIHTPTAAAAARGTYFIVWTTIENGQTITGVVNIGETGRVVVTNLSPKIQGEVELGRHQYTMVDADSPPTPAATMDAGLMQSLVASTQVDDQVADNIPTGMELPGADISMDIDPPQQVEPGQAQKPEPDSGDTALAEVELQGDATDFPSTPPIFEQPGDRMGGGAPATSSLSTTVIFPDAP